MAENYKQAERILCLIFIVFLCHICNKEVPHLELKARLRKRHDRDIRDAISRLKLEEGEKSDIVREGVRRVLVARGLMTIDDIETAIERGSRQWQ